MPMTMMISPLETTIVVLAAGVGYVIYQLFWHPLARYPGPLIGRLTSFHSLYHAFKADRHLLLYRLHEEYGPIVRYGPNHISINDSRAIGEIYGPKSNVQKSNYYTSAFGISLFSCIDRRVHARKRRVTIQAFSDHAVRKMEPYVLSTVRQWCTAIGCSPNKELPGRGDPLQVSEEKLGGWSEPRDMVQWSSSVAFDTLGEIAFGKSFESSIRPDQRYYFKMMALSSRITDITGQMPWLGRHGLDRYLRSRTVADRKVQTALPRQQLAARVAEDPDATERRDILYFLMKARDPDTGKKYSSAELVAECNLLLGAGTDTTATALTATFYFLTQNRSILEHLTRTIRLTFDDVESIVKGPKLEGLKYLQACIDEAMRLCPPVPALLPREVLEGGQTVIGHLFSPGTVVGVPIYTVQHNGAYFDEPFKYRPSRWLEYESSVAGGVAAEEGVDAATLARQRQAFAPFSVGPRSCIAKKVALMELELCVARTLFQFDLRCAPGFEQVGVGLHGEYLTKENFIVGKEGPILQFRPRKD